MAQFQERLDLALVIRGLVPTRSRAHDLIKRGLVLIDGKTALKPSQQVSKDTVMEIDSEAARYVSRGSVKLIRALDEFQLSPLDKVCLDLGASTGGFTQILLERGASHVYALDVGTGQFNKDLAGHPKVTNFENTDVRQFDRQLIAEPVQAVVADLSFISLTLALEAPLRLVAPKSWLIALVKPQFELGPKAVGKGGVVRSEKLRQTSVDRVKNWIDKQPGWRVLGVIPSPIDGKGGNKEFLLSAEVR